MAVDHNSIPANLRPLNIPSPSWAPPPLFHPSAAGADETAAAAKVKLLVSVGGRVLPRPSDGALRYVGGQTRIVSLRRGATVPELMAKMAEALGGPAALKYQPPGEGLDALVSVSSAEDLDNMMDEFDKLAEDSPDGSAKLRAFLFPLSHPADLLADAPLDSAHLYLHAVNALDPPPSDASSATGGGTPAPYVPPAATLVNSSVRPTQLRPEPSIEDNQCVPNHKTYQQPLSQLPPLPPLQDLRQVPPLPPPPEPLRLEDFRMCQKGLPHTHSDTFVHENGSRYARGGSEVNPVFYSQHSEDPTRQRGQCGVMNGTVAESIVKPRIESVIPTSLLRTQGDAQATVKGEIFDHGRVLLPPGTMGFVGDAASPYGMLLSNLVQPHIVGSFQQQEMVWQNLVPPQYPVKADLVAEPVCANGQAAEQVLGFSYEYVRPVDVMMESSRIIPHEVPRLDEKGIPAIRPNAGTLKDLKPDSLPFVVDNGYVSRPQVGGNPIYVNNNSMNTGIVSEGNYVKPVVQLPVTSLDVSHVHTGQLADISHMPTMIGNPRPYSHDLQKGLEPPVPNARLLGMPTYSRGFDHFCNHGTINKIPNEGCKDDASQFQCKNEPNHIAPPLSSNLLFPSLSINSPIEHTQIFQEPLPSNSLFSNQDPWKIIGGANPLPPNPKSITSKYSVISEDSCIENHMERSNGSDILTVLEEGGFHQPLNSPNINGLENVRPTKGIAEEKIKQDLQAVAEDVAASVLQSSTPLVPVFYAHERKEPAAEFNKERGIIEENLDLQIAAVIVDQKIEDIKNMQLEKVNLGLPITDDIGRLQIIKNSDLEELGELGSGAFGSVYHGKWRGTDVAIKRINDRCFDGKATERERMTADFWNEACKLANLHHPNVVAFYGVVVDGQGGSIATVTEFMVNGSLRHVLQRNDKTLDQRKRLLLAMDVAFGMEYLHGKNIVHFDLKSDNLLVNLRDPQRPICKVGDLGLSRVKCRTLISGGVRGTLPWMAPELLNGSSNLVSEKVDVFSFGIVMWELLTGEEPYADLYYGVLLGGIVSNTLRPPVPESCSSEWRLLMEQCWSAEPAERPSFTEIACRLRSMAAALPQKGSAAAHHQAAQPHPQK